MNKALYTIIILFLAAILGMEIYSFRQTQQRYDQLEHRVNSTLDSFYNYTLATGELNDYENE